MSICSRQYPPRSCTTQAGQITMMFPTVPGPNMADCLTRGPSNATCIIAPGSEFSPVQQQQATASHTWVEAAAAKQVTTDSPQPIQGASQRDGHFVMMAILS